MRIAFRSIQDTPHAPHLAALGLALAIGGCSGAGIDARNTSRDAFLEATDLTDGFSTALISTAHDLPKSGGASYAGYGVLSVGVSQLAVTRDYYIGVASFDAAFAPSGASLSGRIEGMTVVPDETRNLTALISTDAEQVADLLATQLRDASGGLSISGLATQSDAGSAQIAGQLRYEAEGDTIVTDVTGHGVLAFGGASQDFLKIAATPTTGLETSRDGIATFATFDALAAKTD